MLPASVVASGVRGVSPVLMLTPPPSSSSSLPPSTCTPQRPALVVGSGAWSRGGPDSRSSRSSTTPSRRPLQQAPPCLAWQATRRRSRTCSRLRCRATHRQHSRTSTRRRSSSSSSPARSAAAVAPRPAPASRSASPAAPRSDSLQATAQAPRGSSSSAPPPGSQKRPLASQSHECTYTVSTPQHAMHTRSASHFTLPYSPMKICESQTINMDSTYIIDRKGEKVYCT